MKGKLKFISLLLITFLLSIPSFSQNAESEKDKVKIITDSLLFDTNYVLGPWAYKSIFNLVDSIKKYGFQKEKIFPFKEFKKVKLYKVNLKRGLGKSCLDHETMELNKFVEKRGKKLNKDQISRLLIILNNPLAFHWLTQESHYLKAGLIFYDFENKIIACII